MGFEVSDGNDHILTKVVLPDLSSTSSFSTDLCGPPRVLRVGLHSHSPRVRSAQPLGLIKAVYLPYLPSAPPHAVSQTRLWLKNCLGLFGRRGDPSLASPPVSVGRQGDLSSALPTVHFARLWPKPSHLCTLAQPPSNYATLGSVYNSDTEPLPAAAFGLLRSLPWCLAPHRLLEPRAPLVRAALQ